MAAPTYNLFQPKKHYRHFNLSEIKNILEENDFIVERFIPVYDRRFNWLQKFLNNKFWELRFCDKIMARLFNIFFAVSNEKNAQMLIVFCKRDKKTI